MDFIWDEAKRRLNLAKHGIDFVGAVKIWNGQAAERRSDRDEERRWIAIGEVEGVVLAVIYTDREETRRRIISARLASRSERAWYRQLHVPKPSEG
ncbi:MAG: uncharacterized protein JWM77_2552 [Rhodospirillales bacterium]|jgi:uncharacterized DUF497 family protein|nr:uncharacterized protein [Rhodospirillales bacterium]